MLKATESKIILGTVQMGINYGINNTTGKISDKDSHSILEYAFDNGIKTLDTAKVYGSAHSVIGEFHKNNPHKKFKVITKFPNIADDNIHVKIDIYLNELNINKLYAILFHSYSNYEENKNNLNSIIKLKKIGKIKYIGVSVYTNEEIEKTILDKNIDIIQMPFNLLDNNNLRGNVIEKAKSKGKIIHSRSALLQGLFFKNINDNTEVVKNLKNEIELINKISLRDKISILKMALGYCLKQKNIDNVIVGVDSLDQLIHNIESENTIITDNTVKSIESILINNPNLLNPSRW